MTVPEESVGGEAAPDKAAGAARPRLLLIGPLPPPFAGPEIGTKTLLESGLRRRWRIDHLNTTIRRSNAEKGRVGPALLTGWARFCAGLARRLARRPERVLYLATAANATGWVRDATFLVLAKLVFRRPVVMQFRGGHFRTAFGEAPRPVRAALGALLRRADRMLVQAERLRAEFEGILPPDRVDVLPNGVDVERLQSVERTPSEEGRVLFIGHLSVAKGYRDLLLAAPEVLRRRPSTRFRIVGTPIARERNVRVDPRTGRRVEDADPRDVFASAIEDAGLAERFEFAGGEVRGRRKLRMLRDADVFVLPSYSEGFSMALLEAMAAGVAVVTTPVGAAPELVRDGWNGYLVEPGDVEALADRIARLLGDEGARRRMGERNARLARERFDVRHQVERLDAILRSVR
ncbi:MAG: glycosyltransferase family 4 protein [Gemmatimonadota bacterium]